MSSRPVPVRSTFSNAVYGLLNPIPFGCFVGALLFDIIYSRSGEIMWIKSAAWLIVFGLLFAVIPRMINLVQVWITSRNTDVGSGRLDFWLNLLAIVVAVFNAFVHSRDAYATMPAGVWLSAITVALLAVAHVVVGTHFNAAGGRARG